MRFQAVVSLFLAASVTAAPTTESGDLQSPATALLEKRGCSGMGNSCKRRYGVSHNGLDYVLDDSCADGKGGMKFSSLSLNSCFGNQGGRIVPGKNFGHSCNNFRRDDKDAKILIFDCGNGKGGHNTARVNIHDHICNRNGQLAC